MTSIWKSPMACIPNKSPMDINYPSHYARFHPYDSIISDHQPPGVESIETGAQIVETVEELSPPHRLQTVAPREETEAGEPPDDAEAGEPPDDAEAAGPPDDIEAAAPPVKTKADTASRKKSKSKAKKRPSK